MRAASSSSRVCWLENRRNRKVPHGSPRTQTRLELRPLDTPAAQREQASRSLLENAASASRLESNPGDSPAPGLLQLFHCGSPRCVRSYALHFSYDSLSPALTCDVVFRVCSRFWSGSVSFRSTCAAWCSGCDGRGSDRHSASVRQPLVATSEDSAPQRTQKCGAAVAGTNEKPDWGKPIGLFNE